MEEETDKYRLSYFHFIINYSFFKSHDTSYYKTEVIFKFKLFNNFLNMNYSNLSNLSYSRIGVENSPPTR